MTQNWREIITKSKDGLNLFARDYGPTDSTKTPVLCLAGVTRNSKDFHAIASVLSEDRRVIATDYRGRGLSDYDKDGSSYQPNIEMADIVDLLDHLSIEKVVVIGTSRGGMIATAMAKYHLDRLAGVVLNDIGPHIDEEGLARVAEAMTEYEVFENWSDVVENLKAFSIGFAGLNDAQWLDFAKCLYRESDSKIKPDYDKSLAKGFPSAKVIRSGVLRDTWNWFALMDKIPVGVIRGENSDLLSKETVGKMKDILPGLFSVTISDRAHVPFLDETGAVKLINDVLAMADFNKSTIGSD